MTALGFRARAAMILRSFAVQGSWNYRTLIGAGFAFALLPALRALYGRDPDGIEFEICWLVPDERIEEALYPGAAMVAPLDIPGEIARYGADTPGGPRTDIEVWKRLVARSSATP